MFFGLSLGQFSQNCKSPAATVSAVTEQAEMIQDDVQGSLLPEATSYYAKLFLGLATTVFLLRKRLV